MGGGEASAQGAERAFYAAIGYLPLGDHAIRADMVERLAAMARQAVRESRDQSRRAPAEAPAAPAAFPVAAEVWAGAVALEPPFPGQ